VETADIEAAVYDALKSDTELTALLANGADSIFHMQAPSDLGSRYPVIVYATISDVPAIAGDDGEITHRVSMRIHIMTLNGDYAGLYRQVCKDMASLGFSRYQAYSYVEDGQIIMIADFRIGVNAEWQQ
jgi:hypothetical protein